MLSSIKIKIKDLSINSNSYSGKIKLNSLIDFNIKIFYWEFVSYFPSNTTNLNKSSINSIGSASRPIVSLNG